ncbi:DUF4906 domain-containing protein [Bacteroides sp.]
MKHFKSIGLWAVGILMLTACTQEDGLTKRNIREVTLEVPVIAPGFDRAGVPLTRSEKVGDEGKIVSLRIVQFDGNEPASKALKSDAVTLGADNKVSFTFGLPESGISRVYMVANFTPTVTIGTTTLKQFEETIRTFAAVTTVSASAGLPMCDFQEFDPAGAGEGPTFTLKAMVAKLKLVCSLSTTVQDKLKDGKLSVSIKNIPNGSFCGTPNSYATAWRPATLAFSDKDNIGTISNNVFEYTIYIPENLAGQKAEIKRLIHRSTANAPAGSTCFMLDGSTVDGETEVHIALFYGSKDKPEDLQMNPSDFNVKRNYAYTLTATVVDLDDTDQRVSMKGDFMYINETNPSWGKEPNVPSDAFGN